MPSVLFDAVIVPEGDGAVDALADLGQAVEFLRDQYRHCKPLMISKAAETLAMLAGVPLDIDSDWAIVQGLPEFLEALGKHRNWERATDPPIV